MPAFGNLQGKKNEKGKKIVTKKSPRIECVRKKKSGGMDEGRLRVMTTVLR